jgi:hypothetical protein
MNKARRARQLRAPVAVLLMALISTSVGAQQGGDQKTPGKFAAFAGTLLQLAAMNYTGPHQQLAHAIVTAFNGGELQDQQAQYDPNDPYGVYGKDVYVFDEPNGADSSSEYSDYESEYQNPGTYPARSPSIDAGLIVRAQDGSLQVIESGATLRGPGGGYAGDRVGVAFAPAHDAYIYVVAFDSTGWIQGLYPDPVLGHRNPVSAGEEILLPGEALFGLDNITGVESIYVLASTKPRPDVESQLAPFLGKERPPAAAGVYRSVERPIIISRGLTGLRPAGVNASANTPAPSNGGSPPVMDSFLAAEGSDELVITLWFNHE